MNEKILIGPSSFATLNYAPKQKLIEAGFQVIDNLFKRKYTKEELVKLLPGVIGLIAGLEPLDREIMEKSDLKVISRCGTGMNNVDLEAARALGIKVYSTPEAPVTAVAELTIGAMLCLLRLIAQMNEDLHDGRWSKKIGTQLHGRIVAIIGYGRIGSYVAKLLHSFNVKLLVVDPHIDKTHIKFSVVSLEEALQQADIVTLHLSGEKEIIGQREFKLMKGGVYLLNASRGGLVDESALIEAIEDGKIAGAWLDSFNEEPYNGPLNRYSQVILTPHVGSYTSECRLCMENEAVENLIKGLKGE